MKYWILYLIIFPTFYLSIYSQQTVKLIINVNDNYVNTPIDSVKISILLNSNVVDSSYTKNGETSFNLLLTDISGQNSELPKSFELSNNYPNPFSSKTSAEIISGANENIYLQLYNVLGQSIYKKGFNLTKGNHTIELDMNGLPSGVYFLQLHGQSKSIVQKLLKLGESGYFKIPSMQVLSSKSSYQGSHTAYKLSGSLTLQLLLKKHNYENIVDDITFTNDTTVTYNLVRNNRIEILVADNNQNQLPMMLNITGPTELNGYSPLSFTGLSGVYNVSGASDSTENLETEFEVLSTDTTITFLVKNLMRNLSVNVIDQYEQQIFMNLNISNESIDTTLLSPFDLRLKKGEYQLYGITDSTSSVDETVLLQNDTTITYQVENSNSDPAVYNISITVIDSTENDQPVIGKYIFFHPFRNNSNIDSLLLDSNGNADVDIIEGRWIFEMPEDDTYAGFTEEIIVDQDNTFTFETASKKEIVIIVAYPDDEGVNNLLINVGDNQIITNEEGRAALNLFPGNYNITSTDARIENINKNILVQSSGQVKEIDVLEKITINYSDKTINEDSELTENLSNYITVGTDLGNVLFIENDENISTNTQTIIPNQDFNGTANFQIKVTAVHGTEKLSEIYTLTINPMMDLRGWVIDNLDYTKVTGKVRINGQVYETGPSGKFDIQLAHSNLLAKLEVWSTKDGSTNSFIKTYRNVPFNQDINDAALWVTTYDQLVNGVDESLKLTPDQFRTLVEKGVGENIKTIDWQNAQNMQIWLDKDFAKRTQPDFFGYDALTGEEQQWIKDVDEQYFLPNIFEEEHKLPIHVAVSGEDCPLYEGTNFFRPDYGYFLVTQKKGPGGYQFSSFDHDNDGVIDAALITVGEPTVGNTRQVLEENSSVMMINGLITDSELAGKTLFHGQNPTSVLSPGDKKVGRIQENMYVGVNASVTPIFGYQLPDGTNVSRFYDYIGKHMDDLLGQ